MDSDFDNRTNGEELGDPNCVWVPGARPERTAAADITHPGNILNIKELKCCIRIIMLRLTIFPPAKLVI